MVCWGASQNSSGTLCGHVERSHHWDESINQGETLSNLYFFLNSGQNNLQQIFIPGAVEQCAVQPCDFQVAVRIL